MRKIELVEGIKSSVIGFGCAPILGSVDSKSSKRALEYALDLGLNHLDLARSYGYGDAEKFVGKVIRGRRTNIVLATKFGIRANWKAKLLNPIKPVVRVIKNSKKKAVAPLSTRNDQNNSIADRFLDRVPLNGKEMTKSLESSLKALNTDYLDYLFIHEPLGAIENIDELTEIAQQLKVQGKIRAWGLAFYRDTQFVHDSYLSRFDVLQFNNSPGSDQYEESVNQRGNNPNVIFSPLSNKSSELSPSEKLTTLFLDFPKSVILCSMFNEKHIKNNLALANKTC